MFLEFIYYRIIDFRNIVMHEYEENKCKTEKKVILADCIHES